MRAVKAQTKGLLSVIQYYWRETDTRQHKDTSLGTPKLCEKQDNDNRGVERGPWVLSVVTCTKIPSRANQITTCTTHNTTQAPSHPPPHRHKTSSQGKVHKRQRQVDMLETAESIETHHSREGCCSP